MLRALSATRPMQQLGVTAGSRGMEMERTSSWMVDHGSLPPVLHRADGRASDSQCVFNMVNACLAIGLLGFPYCFKSCGVLLTALLMVMACSISIFSTSTLLLAAQLCGKRSYEELAAQTFGVAGRWAVMTCLFVLNLGCLVAYINILADVLSSVAGSVIPPGAEPSRNMLLVAVCMLAVLPVSMAVRTSDMMASVSTLSIAFIAIFTMVVVVLSFAPISNPKPVVVWDSGGVMLSAPVILYAFTPHTVLFAVYSTMRSPSVPRMRAVARKSLIGCGAVYFVVGLCGYLAFRQRTAGDVLRNLGGSAVTGLRALYERALRLGYGLAVLGCVPLVMLPLQHTLLPMLLPAVVRLPYGEWLVAPAGPPDGGASAAARPHANGHASPVSKEHPQPVDGMDVSSPFAHALTAALSLLALVCALFVPNVELILGLMGSTAAVGVGIVLPGAILLQITYSHRDMLMGVTEALHDQPWDWKWMRRMGLAMVVGGLLLGHVSTQHLLKAVAEEAEVVQLAQQLHAKEALLLQAAEVEQKARDVAVAVGSMEEAEEALEAVHGGHDEGVTRKSMDSFSRSVEDTNGHIAEAEAFDGKELMEAVDEELEAVEDIVEEVTHLKDNNPIDESEIALGMMVAQSLEGGMDGGKDGGGEGEVAANDASGHPPRPPELVHRRKRHHHGAAAVHELHHKAETAAARLQSTLEKHTPGGSAAKQSSATSPELDHKMLKVQTKVETKLEVAVHAIEEAQESGLQDDGSRDGAVEAVATALNATLDAASTLNNTAGALREATVHELMAIVAKVQALAQKLELLESPPVEDDAARGAAEAAGPVDGGPQKELPEISDVAAALDDDEAGADDAEQKQQLKAVLAGAQASWNATNMNATDAAAKAVQAAEAATSAALLDIKSAVKKADPRVASRAEEIAQEMTILSAIESLAEQNRLEAEKAELGMVVKESPREGEGEEDGLAADDADPESAREREARGGSLGRRGGEPDPDRDILGKPHPGKEERQEEEAKEGVAEQEGEGVEGEIGAAGGEERQGQLGGDGRVERPQQLPHRHEEEGEGEGGRGGVLARGGGNR
eukprot:jgi/Tetstr1/422515/TSEL_001276.t1